MDFRYMGNKYFHQIVYALIKVQTFVLKIVGCYLPSQTSMIVNATVYITAIIITKVKHPISTHWEITIQSFHLSLFETSYHPANKVALIKH